MWFPKLCISLLLCKASWSHPAKRQPGPVLPSEDPFYSPSEGFETAAPGSILRHRTVPFPIAALGRTVDLEASYQVLYRTTDSFGDAIATVATLLVPHNADNSKLLSYQVAEDAAYLNCAPSYALQLFSDGGGFAGTVAPQAELLLMESALQQGWFVTIPDFEGPKAAFLANNLAGQAVLDGIRAVHASSNFTDIDSSPRTVMWGYSGGSMATGFAAELQPTYAPDLTIAGAALGGTVPNISSTLPLTNETPFSGLFPPGVMGLSHEYPEVKDALDSILVPEKQDGFEMAERQCLPADILQFFNQDMYSYLTDPSDISKFAAILDANSMGRHAPQTPLYVYKSIGDKISAVDDTDAVVQSYCDRGTSVTYKRDLMSDHGSMAIIGAPDALLYLKQALGGGGGAASSSCSVDDTVSSLMDPRTREALSQNLLDAFLSLLGKPVGPILIG